SSSPASPTPTSASARRGRGCARGGRRGWNWRCICGWRREGSWRGRRRSCWTRTDSAPERDPAQHAALVRDDVYVVRQLRLVQKRGVAAAEKDGARVEDGLELGERLEHPAPPALLADV